MSEIKTVINNKVPFCGNTDEGTHCFQACLKMILKYYLPDKDFSWEELEKITSKEKGKWTWIMSGLIWLNNNNFIVEMTDSFDYGEFAKSGNKYLESIYGVDVASEISKNSVIEKEQARAGEFIKLVKYQKRRPSFAEIKEYLRNDFLVILIVNSKKLNGLEGYTGHFILITGINMDGNLVFHDPGNPHRPDRVESKETLTNAWSYPDQSANNIIAIKYEA